MPQPRGQARVHERAKEPTGFPQSQKSDGDSRRCSESRTAVPSPCAVLRFVPPLVASSPYMAFVLTPSELLLSHLGAAPCGADRACQHGEDRARRVIVSAVDVDGTDRAFSVVVAVLLSLIDAGEPPALLAGPLAPRARGILNDVGAIIAMVAGEPAEGVKHAVLETWLFDGSSP